MSLLDKALEEIQTLTLRVENLNKVCEKSLTRLNIALELLMRIKRFYPHVFGECVTRDDMKNLEEGTK